MSNQKTPVSAEQQEAGIREIERLPAATALGFHIELNLKNSGYLQAPLIDFNAKSLAVDVTAVGGLETLESRVDSVTVTHGTRTICRIAHPQVKLRKTARQWRLVILLNPAGRKTAERRHARIQTRDTFKAFVWVADPLHLQRVVHFQVDDFNADGLRLRTSLSNKHLLVGSTLENCQLLLPGIGATTVQLVICNAHVQNTSLVFGCRFQEISKPVIEMLAQYAIIGGDGLPAQLVQKKKLLKAAGLTTRILSKPCTVKVAETAEEFEQILQVRLNAYRGAAKTLPDATTITMQDEYDDAAILYCAKHGPDVIATMRANTCQYGGQTFPFEKYFGSCESLGIARHNTCEISKLAILPEFQGSDLFASFVKVAIQMLVKLNLDDMFCMATNKLSPMYQKIGGERITEPVRHPVLKNEFLTLHRIKTSSFLTGAHMDFQVWKKIAEAAIHHLASYGFLSAADSPDPVDSAASIFADNMCVESHA